MPLPRVTESVYDLIAADAISKNDNQALQEAAVWIASLEQENRQLARLVLNHRDKMQSLYGPAATHFMLVTMTRMYRLLEMEQAIRDATAEELATLPVVQKADTAIGQDLLALTIQMSKEQPLLSLAMVTIAKSAGPPDFQELAFRMSVMTYSILARAAKRELLESNTKEPV